MQGTGNGIAAAKKLANLYESTNTNSSGKVTNPDVYSHIIDSVLSPFAGSIDGQNAIADYKNKQKALITSNNETDTSLASLKQKEYASWYNDDDGEDATSFRNPAWVARMSSESLDQLVAETVMNIQDAEDNKRSTAELKTYLNDLTKKADRMRTISDSLDSGEPVNLDGYGYFIDSDPNTGVIRGASFMPTDVNLGDLSKDTIRTDSTVQAGNKKIPVYLPYVKDASGATKAMFGGKEYTGNKDLLSGGDSEILLTDKNAYKKDSANFEIGKVYRTYSGKTNLDGSPKSDYYYPGYDNKLYKFSDEDPAGQALLKSLKDVGVFSDVKSLPRLSPTLASTYNAQPLPSDAGSFSETQRRGALGMKIGQENQVLAAEADKSLADNFWDVVTAPDSLRTSVDSAVSGVASGISSFFGRKNRQSALPKQPTSSGGNYSAPDVVASGSSFFKSKPQ